MAQRAHTTTTSIYVRPTEASERQENSAEVAVDKLGSLPEKGAGISQMRTNDTQDREVSSSRDTEGKNSVTHSGLGDWGDSSVPVVIGNGNAVVNGRRYSRKTGVYVQPSPHVLGQGHDKDDGRQQPEEQQTQRRSSASRVTVISKPDSGMREPDSDTNNLTLTTTPTTTITLSPPSDDEVSSTERASQQQQEAWPQKQSNGTVNEDKDDHNNSRFLSQLHPVYEKKLHGVLKNTRKVSLDSSLPSAHRHHLTGTTRRISLHNRKMSQGSDSSHSVSVVSSHKNSMVLIDQIPQIIQQSLHSYLQVPDHEAIEEEEDRNQKGAHRPTRVSIFSLASRRDSLQSDVTFWDPQESLPHVDHYRLAIDQYGGFRPRPTLYQLREEPESPTRPSIAPGDDLEDEPDTEKGNTKDQIATSPTNKQGWIRGVLVRCLLNIFGVMLFLRLTWITGQAGMGLASVIVLLSAVVTMLTTMSMAAICTNGEVRGGGAYYMISRSLGPEFGGAIGIIFSLANAVAAAMYVVGFAETLRDLVKDQGGVITGDTLHDVRVIGTATTVLLMAIVMIGLDFESKAQLVLLFILCISILNYFIGTFIPPSEDKRRAGVVGYQADVFMQNVGPDFRQYDGIDYSFFTVFAIFFPAATGILAGANISGDLKNPSTAIPRGTFLAILLTTIVYLTIIWSTGSCMLRDAIGTAVTIATNVTMSLTDIQSCVDNVNVTCTSGLHHTHTLMGIASGFQPLIYAGIFSATLSSALASLVSAPKVFQALGKDKLFPFIAYFAKDYGKDGEPRRGYVLSFFICLGMTCIGSVDAIAPIISNFFLMAYALINFSCFDAAFANSPGFRPSYRLYNKWSSLAGALVCIIIMFMISWWSALITMLVVTALYVFLKHRNPDVNWGSSGQAHVYSDALKNTLKLVDVNEHVKNFRPQILALTGYPRNRPTLVDFASAISKRQSLLVCAHVFQGDMQRHLRHLRSTAAYRWFRNRDVRAFYTSVAAQTIRHGTQSLLQSQGLGKLRPNTLLLGFKNKWQLVDPRNVHNYVGIIHDAFDLNYGVGVLRVPGGMDTHKVSDILLDSTDDTLDDLDQDSIDDDVSEAEEESDRRKNDKLDTIFSEKPDSPTSPTGDILLHDIRIPSQQGAVNKGYYLGPNDDEYDENDDYENDADDNDDDDDDDDDDDNNETKKADEGEEDKLSTRKDTLQSHGREDKAPKETPSERKNPPVLRSVLSKADSSNDADMANFFRGKQSGTIDVWWLFDDGGLGLLLPYILSTRKQWKQCKLRVFCAGTKRSNLDIDHRRMAALLSKFRIDYSDITVLPDLRRKPRRRSYKEFEQLIYRWRLQPGEYQDDYPWKVSDTDLAAQKDKIYMQIKIREKLLEHSNEASLIVVTLPVPHKFCPAGLYMAWLDTLTRDLPPTLLLRGNQQSVLTYFS